MKDHELEEFLSQLRKENPNDLQMAKWKRAVKQEVKAVHRSKRISFFSDFAKVAAGVVFGVLISNADFSEQKIENNFDDDATIEVIYDNRG